MDDLNLLKYATTQEKAIAATINCNFDPAVIRGFKFSPNSTVLPWLIWEYGLSELLNWVPNPAQVIQDGVKFQRIKGTPAAVKMALSWLGAKDVVIEEGGIGNNFAEFQLGINGIPDDTTTENIIALTKLSAPVRAHLKRIYNEQYDIRSFTLDSSPWGDILSDYSGIRAKGILLSFGRKSLTEINAPLPTVDYTNFRRHYSDSVSTDVYRLDFAVLGETEPHVINHRCFHESLLMQVSHVALISGAGESAIESYSTKDCYFEAEYDIPLRWHQQRHMKRTWHESITIATIH